MYFINFLRRLIFSKFSASIFLLIIITSCNSRENKIKEVITNHLNDEFFKNNLSLNIIKIKLEEREQLPIDSLIRYALKGIACRKTLEFERDNPNQYNSITFNSDELQSLYLNDPQWIRLKSIQNQYSISDIGESVKYYIKASYTDQYGKVNNILWDKEFYILDKNLKIIYSFTEVRFNE